MMLKIKLYSVLRYVSIIKAKTSNLSKGSTQNRAKSNKNLLAKETTKKPFMALNIKFNLKRIPTVNPVFYLKYLKAIKSLLNF